MVDIYFDPNYGRLNESLEDGTTDLFRFESPFGSIHHMFIRRELHLDDGRATDLITPYGYGGPRIVEGDEVDHGRLVEHFNIDFAEYCRDQAVVSEFVRFHPVANNASAFSRMYALRTPRQTVGTRLQGMGLDPIAEEFTKSCRKNVRRALSAGVEYRITEGPSRLDKFQEVYYATLDRNRATDFYYFPASYFADCARLIGDYVVTVEALFDGRIIAMNLCLVSDGVIHIHLSGSLSKYLFLSPAYVLRYAIATWVIEKGHHLIHHGGGRTGDLDDPLLRFKGQFGRNTRFEFVVGTRIWDRARYARACSARGVEATPDGFFPAYRSR